MVENNSTNTTKLVNKILEKGSLELLPGKLVINLFDPLTDRLISSSLKKLAEDPLFDKSNLIGISGSDALRFADQRSNGEVRRKLIQSGKSVIKILESLQNVYPTIGGMIVQNKQIKLITKRDTTEANEAKKTSSSDTLIDKRNFDEIDRSGFSGFYKRNFDEIDRSGFSGFRGRRNFDEIDRSGFSGFYKRPDYSIMYTPYKRNFDEIDRSGFSGFYKRNFDEIDRSGFSGFRGKRNFDEIDRSGFSGFYKRNFDEMDNSAFSGFVGKRNRFVSPIFVRTQQIDSSSLMPNSKM